MKDINDLKKIQRKIIEKNNKINLIAFFITIGIMIASFVLTYISAFEAEYIFGFLFGELIFSLIVVAIVKHCINGKDINKFDKNFKNLLVSNILKENFQDVVYEPYEGFDESFVNSIGMFDTADRYHSNDLLSASYKGIKFKQADVHTEDEHTDDEGHVSYTTRFKGRLMEFDFNKKFKANIRVTTKKFDSSKLPWRKTFDVVKMEDVEFNKQFRVYAENEHDAFYILTPHFMTKLKDICNKVDGELMFCFVNNKLYIAVDNYNDCFEWSVFEEIDDAKVKSDILDDIKLITDFVNELNLENDLFKK